MRYLHSFILGLGAVLLAAACGGDDSASQGSGGSSGSTGTGGGAAGSGSSGSGGSGGSSTGTAGNGGSISAGGSSGSGGAGGSGGSGGSGGGAAGSGGASADAGPKSMTSFFISTPSTTGGNLGGLMGADMKCQMEAMGIGAGGRVWKAYLSVKGNAPVNARDRIGMGPWFNPKGEKIADNLVQLHEEGMMNNLSATTGVDAMGVAVPSSGMSQHDILTGSGIDGKVLPADADHTCMGWTSNAMTGMDAQVGHFNQAGGGANPMSWNSAHATPGCTQAQFVQVGGAGRIYRFASD